MTDILMSCLPATKKQRVALARLLKRVGAESQDTENFDIDREAARSFIWQLLRKVKHHKSDLD